MSKSCISRALGDPLMHPDFFRMVEYARARGTQSDHWSRDDWTTEMATVVRNGESGYVDTRVDTLTCESAPSAPP